MSTATKQSLLEAGPAKDRKDASLAKYNLRTKSIQNRIEVQRRTTEPRHPKPKQKPAPLSKYRRRTANFRERCRMQEMNDAFKRLQSAVPDVFAPEETPPARASAESAKATKINTLKLAVNYISALTQMLNGQADSASAPQVSSSKVVNNENLYSAGKSECAKSQKCHTIHSIGASAPASLPDVSHRKDLTCVQSCPQTGSFPSKVSPFDFEVQPQSSLAESVKVSPYKVICERAAGSAIASDYDFTSHLASDLQLAHCSEPFANHHQQSDTFDLSAYSLAGGCSSLLDDFSALIEDLHEDNFCLVDELIE